MTLDSLAGKLQQITNNLKRNRYINAISEGLISLFPVLMVGAFFSIFNGLAWDPWKNFLDSTGLKTLVSLPVTFTTNLISLYASFAVAYKFSESCEKDGYIAGFISMISFLLLTPLAEDGHIATTYLGAAGMFASFVVALAVSTIYVYMVNKNMVIKMPKGVPSTTAKSFTALIPLFAVVLFDLAVYFLFKATSFGSIHGLIYSFLQVPLSKLGNTFLVFLFLKFLTNVLWVFGIHGGLVMYSIAVPLWLSMDYANTAAYAEGSPLPYILGYAFGMLFFQPTGTGNTIGLNILMLRAKSKRYKTLGKLALPSSIVGVNEPILFGTPIVMNPTLVVPFIVHPLLCGTIAYFLTLAGILPRLNGVFMFGIPVGLSGFIAGGWRVALFQLLMIPFSYICYAPFFKKMDEEAYSEELAAETQNAD